MLAVNTISAGRYLWISGQRADFRVRPMRRIASVMHGGVPGSAVDVGVEPTKAYAPPLSKRLPHHSDVYRGKAAEVEGFEPPVPFGTPVFKTGAISHSAKLPKRWLEDLNP